MTSEQQAQEQLDSWLETLSSDQDDELCMSLDEWVHDLKGQEAADINNGGTSRQLAYILEGLGGDLRELFKQLALPKGVTVPAEVVYDAPGEGESFSAGGPDGPMYQGEVTVELTGYGMMHQRRNLRLERSYTEAEVQELAKDTAGNHEWKYEGMDDDTIVVSIATS